MNPSDSATAEQPSTRLNDTELKEMMRLVKGAHSVELKLSVPASAHRATIQGLPTDPVEAQARQIYFFDTPDLQLFKAGVVVRARRIAGGRGDTVIKLRPVEPDGIPAGFKNDSAFNIEVDAAPGGFVCLASFKGRSTGRDIRDAVSGKKRTSKLFSKAQRAFFRLHAPIGIELDALVPLGPTFILKGKFDAPMGLNGKAVRTMVAEMWLYPDGSRLLELSTKCLPSEALAVASEARMYLVDRGVPTNAPQEMKTRTALEFYSKALIEEMAEEKAASLLAPATRTAPKAAAKPAAKTAPKKAAKAASKPASKKPAAANVAATRAVSTRSAPAKKSAAAKTAAAKTAAAKTAAAKPAAKPATTTRRAPAARSRTSSTRQSSSRRSPR